MLPIFGAPHFFDIKHRTPSLCLGPTLFLRESCGARYLFSLVRRHTIKPGRVSFSHSTRSTQQTRQRKETIRKTDQILPNFINELGRTTNTRPTPIPLPSSLLPTDPELLRRHHMMTKLMHFQSFDLRSLRVKMPRMTKARLPLHQQHQTNAPGSRRHPQPLRQIQERQR